MKRLNHPNGCFPMLLVRFITECFLGTFPTSSGRGKTGDLFVLWWYRDNIDVDRKLW